MDLTFNNQIGQTIAGASDTITLCAKGASNGDDVCGTLKWVDLTNGLIFYKKTHFMIQVQQLRQRYILVRLMQMRLLQNITNYKLKRLLKTVDTRVVR